MAVRKKYYSIYQLAREWSLNRVNIMQLIIADELKVSILQNDGGIKTFDTFSDIPVNLRENLKVVRPKRVPKDEYNKLLQSWDQLIITADEVMRYKLNNIEADTPNSGISESDNLHLRKEKTLLTIIAALLNVIIGPYGTKEVEKHQSIKNISDLVTKLSEMGDPGLSKSNLEKYFSLAKKTLNSNAV